MSEAHLASSDQSEVRMFALFGALGSPKQHTGLAGYSGLVLGCAVWSLRLVGLPSSSAADVVWLRM